MAVIKKFLCLILLVSLVGLGNCDECSLKNMKISQTTTGGSVNGKTQWNVTISNDCKCDQLSVKLDCDGFQTTEDVDPSILAQSGAVCLLNGGNPIHYQRPITFYYAWDTSFSFTPLYSLVQC